MQFKYSLFPKPTSYLAKFEVKKIDQYTRNKYICVKTVILPFQAYENTLQFHRAMFLSYVDCALVHETRRAGVIYFLQLHLPVIFLLMISL
jgi:hypothetical protein